MDSLAIIGDVLTAQFTLSNPEAESKVVNSGGVSVEIREPFIDGLGNEYDVMLTHLGIVNHPVIPDQGPFKRLSLEGKPQMSKPRYAVRQLANGQSFVRRLAEGDVVAPDETETATPPEQVTPTELPSVDQPSFDALLPIVNDLLEDCYGIVLPEGTTPENFISNLKNTVSIASQMMGGDNEASEATSPNPTSVPDLQAETVDPAGLSLSISPKLKQANATIKALQLQLKAVEDEKAKVAAEREKERQLALKQAEVNYKARVTKLAHDGFILATSEQGLIEAGKAAQWSMSILDAIPTENPVLNTNSKTRKLSAGAAPEGGNNSYRAAREVGLRMAGLLPPSTNGTK